MMRFKTPWDNPDSFESIPLREIIRRKKDYGLNTSLCNLWDGNEAWVNKTIDPYPKTATDTHVSCLYSGVAMKRYPLYRVVYLEKQT